MGRYWARRQRRRNRMIKNIWCVICQYMITSNQNLVSYINCLEEITVPKLPVSIPPVTLGSLWEKSGAEAVIFKVRGWVELPSGTKKYNFETADIKFDKKKHRVNFVIEGLQLEEEGVYNFAIECFDGGKWNFVKRIPLYVKRGRSR